MIHNIWILTKKDYKEILVNPIQLLIIVGYLIFFNFLPLIDSLFRDQSSLNTTLFSVGVSALFPIFNISIQAFSRERKNRVLDLLMVKISPITICMNKLLTSLSMSLIFAVVSLLFQAILNKIFFPGRFDILQYLIDSNLFLLTFKLILPIILLISLFGVLIAVFLPDNIRMYGYAVILIVVFSSFRLLINQEYNILTNNSLWIPITLWLVCFLPLSIILFVVDKERMLKG